GRDSVERHHLVLRSAVLVVARADRRPGRRCCRQGRVRGTRRQGIHYHQPGDRALTHARLRAGHAADDHRGTHVLSHDAPPCRPLVSPTAVRLGFALQPGTRRQRRAEDDGHYRHAAVRRWHFGRNVSRAFLGGHRLSDRHGPGHAVRRLAHREDDGHENHQAETGGRVLRRDGQRDHALSGYRAGHPGVDYAYDHRRDHRRRRHPQAFRRALGCRRAHRGGGGADDSLFRVHRGAGLVDRSPRLSRRQFEGYRDRTIDRLLLLPAPPATETDRRRDREDRGEPGVHHAPGPGTAVHRGFRVCFPFSSVHAFPGRARGVPNHVLPGG